MSIVALGLVGASLAAWIVSAATPFSVRAYIRFACALYATLAVAVMADGALGDAVTMIVSAVAPMMLALAALAAFRAKSPATLAAIVLALACVAGMLAAATGVAAFAFAPLGLGVIAMIAASLRRIGDAPAAALQLFASALSFFAGAAAGAAGSLPALMIFSAVGLFGAALALTKASAAAVEEKRGQRAGGASAIGPLG